MRSFILTITAVIIVCGSAAAAWKEYPYPDLGFAINFPGDPTMSTGNYKSGLVPGAPVHNFNWKEGYSLFIASVVDLLDRKEEGANIIGEAESNYTFMGDVIENSISRVEGGRNAVWGHFLTIECRKSKIPDQPGLNDNARVWFTGVTGIECSDKTRITVNMYFNRGRLYLIHGINLPNPEDDSTGPNALRFANGVSFFSPDGTLGR